MKSLYDYIQEGQIDALAIHEICLAVENDQQFTNRKDAMAKALIKKGDKNGPECISFERLWTSSMIDQFLRDICKKLDIRLDRGEERNAAKRYVSSIVMWEVYESTDWKFTDWTPEDWDYSKLEW